MKKLLLIAVLCLSAVSFAKGHGNMGNGNMGNGGMMNGSGNCLMMDSNMTPELRKEMRNDMISIQEKNLEISKIMNTENPDMKKVEKLNSEIYGIKAAHRTKMQQNMLKTK
ncbi:hypothetical protein [Cetobacterium sp.]|uniref:hypothetical protein n=1 Tax=Cetobacterium sp. TaxID=2071632 RepID=UPI003F3C3D46